MLTYNQEAIIGKYKITVGKADGFCRHTPCFYKNEMVREERTLKNLEFILQFIRKALSMTTESEEIAKLEESKDLWRWHNNDSKRTYQQAQKGFQNQCVGSLTCEMEYLIPEEQFFIEKEGDVTSATNVSV